MIYTKYIFIKKVEKLFKQLMTCIHRNYRSLLIIHPDGKHWGPRDLFGTLVKTIVKSKSGYMSFGIYTQNICKECFQTQNTPFLYLKLLQICYFMLHLDYVE